jgi:hypothetical protein
MPKPSVKICRTVPAGFEAVREAFAENFSPHDELGAAFCLYHNSTPRSPRHAQSGGLGRKRTFKGAEPSDALGATADAPPTYYVAHLSRRI